MGFYGSRTKHWIAFALQMRSWGCECERQSTASEVPERPLGLSQDCRQFEGPCDPSTHVTSDQSVHATSGQSVHDPRLTSDQSLYHPRLTSDQSVYHPPLTIDQLVHGPRLTSRVPDEVVLQARPERPDPTAHVPATNPPNPPHNTSTWLQSSASRLCALGTLG